MSETTRSSLQLNRKPLSDCTNNRQPLQIPKTLIKPLKKPGTDTPITRSTYIRKNKNLNFSVSYGNCNVVSSSSVRSRTSTGSNNSPISDAAVDSPISGAGDVSGRRSRPSTNRIVRHNQQTREDVGKSVEATHIVQEYLCLPSWEAQNKKVDEQKTKDRGKMIVETPIIHKSAPWTSHALQTTSSAASGTDGQERTGLIVYNQRRTSQRKMLTVGSASLPFSCPPDKLSKKKGVKLNAGGSDGHFRAHTDLPLQKKKRSNKLKEQSIHGMPQDEVDKLKAYYADIDTFELPVASEGESDE